MHFKVENPKEELLKNGYKQYGLNTYQFIKPVPANNRIDEFFNKNAYFHAIVDYYDRYVSIHIDKPYGKSFKSYHKTIQEHKKINKEITTIKRSTLDYKLNAVKNKYILKLSNKLRTI